MFFVYIIKSHKENWFYVGSTSNLDQRLKYHNNGNVRSTKARKPFSIVYTEEYSSIDKARSREKEIKSKRKENERIIDGLIV